MGNAMCMQPQVAGNDVLKEELGRYAATKDWVGGPSPVISAGWSVSPRLLAAGTSEVGEPPFRSISRRTPDERTGELFGPAGGPLPISRTPPRTPSSRTPGRTPPRSPAKTTPVLTPSRTPPKSPPKSPRGSLRGGSAASSTSQRMSEEYEGASVRSSGSSARSDRWQRREDEKLDFLEKVKNHVALRSDVRGFTESEEQSAWSDRTGIIRYDRGRGHGGRAYDYDRDPYNDRSAYYDERSDGSPTSRGGSRGAGARGGSLTPRDGRTSPRDERNVPRGGTGGGTSSRGGSGGYGQGPPTETRRAGSRSSDNRREREPHLSENGEVGVLALADLAVHSNGKHDTSHAIVLAGSQLAAHDLESKLRLAQRKVDEANQRYREEQERAQKAETQLQNARTAQPGGSDLEYQLMQNLVQLRSRCNELDTQAQKEQQKANEIREQLDQEKKSRAAREVEVRDLSQLRENLLEKLESLKAKSQELEREVQQRGQENQGLTRKLELVEVERDETIQLAERAVKLKEKEKKVKMQKEAEIDLLKKRQLNEQDSFRNVLLGVDQLLAKLRKSESGGGNQEAIRELLGIRDEMRQLIKKKNQPVHVLPTVEE